MKSCLQFFHRIFSPSPGPPSRGLVLVAVAASLLFVSSTFAVAQEASSIVGTVTLENTGGALHGARVLIINLGRSTLSDEDGRFRFDGVPAGQHELLAMREHLQADRQTVEVGAGEATTVDFALALAAVHEEVTVTATGRITTAFDAFNTVQALDSIDLAQNMAGNLGELLENEPGVAKRSFGPGSSRPIIRGFDNDRVLLMQDGVRSGDLSSQSGDHGVSIDPAALGRVEILKGPATLLYGSNAIGGVVNAISPHQAFYENPPAELRGQLNADLGSTNEQAGGNANFQVGNGKIMAWFGGGGRRTSEYITPEGTVENSQTEQMNGRAGLGWFGDRDYISVSYEIEDGTYGIPFAGELHGHHEEEEEEEEEEPLIDIDQRRQVVRVEGGLRNLQGRFIDGVKAILQLRRLAAPGDRELRGHRRAGGRHRVRQQALHRTDRGAANPDRTAPGAVRSMGSAPRLRGHGGRSAGAPHPAGCLSGLRLRGARAQGLELAVRWPHRDQQVQARSQRARSRPRRGRGRTPCRGGP